MLQRLGIILFILGMAMGDSENLVIPAALIAAGIGLVWLATGREADHEAD